MAGSALAGSILLALIGRDLVASGSDGRGEARLLGLFTYNYHRAWPDSLDFRTPLVVTVALFCLLTLLLLFRRVRPHAGWLLVATALGYAVWGLDVYLPRCAPHWGQREIFEAYRRSRSSPDEPIIAYRMNWLGEYFYSSNRIPAFGIDASAGASLSQYVQAEIGRGKTTMFFVSEHASMGGLRNELGATKSFERITDANLNNKFGLVRATFDRR
jgi:hypothetical protein